jgi:hypothetical protein
MLGDRAVRFHAAGIRRELRGEAIMEARSA